VVRKIDFSRTKKTKKSILVDRLIKYTGYGNAAGLLYDFGLLGPQHNANKEQYSSDSDESDTESYRKLRDQYG